MINWVVRYSCSLGRDSSTCVKWFVGVFAEETNRSGQLIPDAVLLVCGTSFQLTMACPLMYGAAHCSDGVGLDVG